MFLVKALCSKSQALKRSYLRMASSPPALKTVIINGLTVPVTSENGVDLSRAIECTPFKDWCATMEPPLKVHSVTVTDIDYFGSRVGFLKFKADVESQGVRVPGIVFARGGAVAILVIVRCEGEKFALCCRQARVPAGKASFCEIPAGDFAGFLLLLLFSYFSVMF
jgi:ADP-sugar diphosphatase